MGSMATQKRNTEKDLPMSTPTCTALGGKSLPCIAISEIENNLSGISMFMKNGIFLKHVQHGRSWTAEVAAEIAAGTASSAACPGRERHRCRCRNRRDQAGRGGDPPWSRNS